MDTSGTIYKFSKLFMQTSTNMLLVIVGFGIYSSLMWLAALIAKWFFKYRSHIARNMALTVIYMLGIALLVYSSKSILSNAQATAIELTNASMP